MTERVTLWHPDSPGTRVHVHPCLLRRLGIIRAPFATFSELRNATKPTEYEETP